ncbi:MAG: tetratricopeptide repeat protein [Pseudomonadota bacterium]
MTRFALPGKVLYRHIKTRCPSEPATSPSITLGLGELNSASKHYTAFISYSHDDAEHVAWLQKRIETFRPQKLLNESAPQSLAPIFKDRDELPSAADLSTVISSALENTRWLIVACSPSAAKSPWVDAEIRQFKRLHGNDRVLAYIVRGEPTATNPEEACFPPALLEKIDAGGQVIGRIEPVAADARPHADGRDNASLKIIAGLLEVGFDALRQRDAQRRQKRLMMISVASVAGFLIASTLATLAVIARNEADEQRQRAEIEARTASRTSEFMVNIFAVAAPSEARGRQITAAEILARGVERIDNLNEAPEIQVNLLHTMGQVHTGLGLYGDATTLLSRAQALRSVQSEEESIATQVALAEALVFKGTYDEAKAEIDTAIDRLPVKVWSTTHSKAYNVLGDVLVKQQKPAAAQTAYRTALDNDRIALESAGEESTNAMANLARSETGVATALVYQGNFAAATPLFQSSLDHYKASLGEDHPQVAVTHNNLGNTYYFLQDWPKVLQQYAQALPLARRLFGDKHPEVAVMLHQHQRHTLSPISCRYPLSPWVVVSPLGCWLLFEPGQQDNQKLHNNLRRKRVLARRDLANCAYAMLMCVSHLVPTI